MSAPCGACNGSGLCDIDGSPCGACNGAGEIEEHNPASDEMARLRAELAEARAKLEQAKRAAFVGWSEICGARFWGFDPTEDHIRALIHHGKDWVGKFGEGRS